MKTMFLSPDSEYDVQFEREAAAFEAMHPKLLRDYEGKYVAIYQGSVADVDDDNGALFDRMIDKYGENVPFYIQKVIPEGIPTVKIPGIDVE